MFKLAIAIFFCAAVLVQSFVTTTCTKSTKTKTMSVALQATIGRRSFFDAAAVSATAGLIMTTSMPTILVGIEESSSSASTASDDLAMPSEEEVKKQNNN